jgi:hypothetical protein
LCHLYSSAAIFFSCSQALLSCRMASVSSHIYHLNFILVWLFLCVYCNNSHCVPLLGLFISWFLRFPAVINSYLTSRDLSCLNCTVSCFWHNFQLDPPPPPPGGEVKGWRLSEPVPVCKSRCGAWTISHIQMA